MKTIDNSRNKLIVKSNRLIEAKYRLSVREQKFILYIASLVNKGDTDFKYKKIKVRDIEDILKGDETKKWGSIYEVIKDISQTLNSKPLYVKEESGWELIYWFASIKAEKNKGIITFELSERMKPFLLELKGYFTKYRFSNILSLRSGYSIRIYELLKLNQFKGKVRYEINHFRELIGASYTDPLTNKEKHKYKEYKAFKRSVLNHAQKEIQRETDIYFELREEREDRKVKYLVFYVFKNKDNKNPNSDLFSEPAPSETTDTSEFNDTIIAKFIEIGLVKSKAEQLYNTGFNAIEEQDIRKQIVIQNRSLDEYFLEKIEYVNLQTSKGGVKNPPGLLLKAIKENYQNAEILKKRKLKTYRKRTNANNEKKILKEAQLQQLQKDLYQKEKKIIDELVGQDAYFFDKIRGDVNIELWTGYDKNKSSLENYRESKGILKAKFEALIKEYYVEHFQKFEKERTRILQVKRETQLL